MAINKISGGASKLIRYQRSGTRHRTLRRARSRTPALPLTRAVTINAGTADPRTFSSTPCGSLRRAEARAQSTPWEQRPGPPSSIHQHKKVATGCLTIHDLSGDASARPRLAVGSAMIGTSLKSHVMRQHYAYVQGPPPAP